MSDRHLITRRAWVAASAAMTATVALGRGRILSAASNPPSAPVSIAKVPTYDEDLLSRLVTMFDQIGGIGSLVKGKTVTVKLNLTGSGRYEGYTPGQTYWVHLKLVCALCAALEKAGAKRIRLVEGAGARTELLEDKMLNGGWNVREIRSAASVVEFENTDTLGQGKRWSRLKVPGNPLMYPAYDLNHSYEDTDVFVSMAKMKHHANCGVTLSLKNVFGITPTGVYLSRESVFHYGKTQPPSGVPAELDPNSSRYDAYRLPRIVTDLAAARPIDLQIIDGIESCVGGEGPWIKGSKYAHPGRLVVGLNPVCTDAVATAVMGYDPRARAGQIPFRDFLRTGDSRQYADNTMLVAEAAGIGTADLKRIDVRGVPIREAVCDFEGLWKG